MRSKPDPSSSRSTITVLSPVLPLLFRLTTVTRIVLLLLLAEKTREIALHSCCAGSEERLLLRGQPLLGELRAPDRISRTSSEAQQCTVSANWHGTASKQSMR